MVLHWLHQAEACRASNSEQARWGCSQQGPRSQQLPRATARVEQVLIRHSGLGRKPLCSQLDLYPESDREGGRTAVKNTATNYSESCFCYCR